MAEDVHRAQCAPTAHASPADHRSGRDSLLIDTSRMAIVALGDLRSKATDMYGFASALLSVAGCVSERRFALPSHCLPCPSARLARRSAGVPRVAMRRCRLSDRRSGTQREALLADVLLVARPRSRTMHLATHSDCCGFGAFQTVQASKPSLAAYVAAQKRTEELLRTVDTSKGSVEVDVRFHIITKLRVRASPWLLPRL